MAEAEEKTKFYYVKKGLSFFGIVLSAQTKHPVHLTRVFFIWIAIFLGILMVGGMGLYEYSTHPSFCNSCHIMEPYYNAWKTSRHYGHAPCVDCHYPPPKSIGEHFWHKFQASAQVIKYITRTYSSKPFADVVDASCLRSGCHSNRLLEGRIVTARGIKFDHRPHLMETRRGRQLRCVSCHSQIVVGKHIEVTYDTCFLCHFKEREEGTERKPTVDCLGCHELPTQSFQIGNMTYNHKDFVTERGISCQNCHGEVSEGEGKAREDRCFTCHNQPEKLSHHNDTPFMHETHVTKHHVACLHCHEEMPHGRASLMVPSESQPAAESRPLIQPGHPPSLTFDCKYCHENKHGGQLKMYRGEVSSLGVTNMPSLIQASPMYLANVDCIGCHYEQEGGKEKSSFVGRTFKASSKACIKCHGPEFNGIWEETETELKSTLEALEKKLGTVEAALGTTALEELKKKVLQVKLWQQFVRDSRGEHNIYLASSVLREEDKTLSEMGQALQASLPDLSNLPLISGSYCATMCHAKIGVKVPPEKVKFFGKEMPHLMHTSLMGCVTCHDIGTHKKIPLKKGIKESVCVGCHPK